MPSPETFSTSLALSQNLHQSSVLLFSFPLSKLITRILRNETPCKPPSKMHFFCKSSNGSSNGRLQFFSKDSGFLASHSGSIALSSTCIYSRLYCMPLGNYGVLKCVPSVMLGACLCHHLLSPWKAVEEDDSPREIKSSSFSIQFQLRKQWEFWV